jgi:hypothetical protein
VVDGDDGHVVWLERGDVRSVGDSESSSAKFRVVDSRAVEFVHDVQWALGLECQILIVYCRGTTHIAGILGQSPRDIWVS